MKKFLSFAVYALMSSSLLVSCGGDDDKTEDEPEDEVVAPQTVSPSYDYANSGGFFAAVNTQTEISTSGAPSIPGVPTTISFITAVAGIWETPGGSFLDAGTITFAGESLSKQENNSYVLTPEADSFTGLGSITESDAKAWTVTTPEINFTNTKAYPKVTGFSSASKTITKGEAFTINWGANSGAPDSVLVVISSGETLMKTVGGDKNTSVTFTAEETNTLSTGSNALIQVTPYNFNKQTFASKEYYFINQTTYSDITGEVK